MSRPTNPIPRSVLDVIHGPIISKVSVDTGQSRALVALTCMYSHETGGEFDLALFAEIAGVDHTHVSAVLESLYRHAVEMYGGAQ